MNDFVVSKIRTYVPLVVSWFLLRVGEWTMVDIDGEALITAVVGLVAAVWYAIARGLEQRWPQAGWLIGYAKTPSYDGEGD